MTCSVPCFHWCLAFATIPTSSSAANFVGPKQGTPLAFKASAKPAQSGASGPTKTRATFFSSNLDSDGLNHGTKHGTKHNTYHQTEVKWWKGFCFQRIEQPIWRLNHFDMPVIKLKLLCCSSEGRDIAVTNGQVGHPLLSTGSCSCTIALTKDSDHRRGKEERTEKIQETHKNTRTLMEVSNMNHQKINKNRNQLKWDAMKNIYGGKCQLSKPLWWNFQGYSKIYDSPPEQYHHCQAHRRHVEPWGIPSTSLQWHVLGRHHPQPKRPWQPSVWKRPGDASRLMAIGNQNANTKYSPNGCSLAKTWVKKICF